MYQYIRRVPADLVDHDTRAPAVRCSLRTDDLELARAKRDELERLDDGYWRGLRGAGDDPSPEQYRAAVLRAGSLGFEYKSADELASESTDLRELLRRLTILIGTPPGSATSQALLGLVPVPKARVTDAFDVYLREIVPHELVWKSEKQKADWRKVKSRAVANFVEVVGNVPISEISRHQALQFYGFWMSRIAPAGQTPTHSASSGNRDVGNMRQLFRAYHAHIGDHGRANPFDGLTFRNRRARTRPPFSVEWISRKLLQPGPIQHLNREARAVLLMMVETGARPSEIANLSAETISLKADVPHIIVTPREDPEDPREIKTVSSVRRIPLVGVALAAAEAYPNGFPRYWNREGILANTLTKGLRRLGLVETDKHSAYSLRHSFEDRMKEGQVDEELRRQLMGHTIDRPKYGTGGSLPLLRAALLKIALPFDPAILH